MKQVKRIFALALAVMMIMSLAVTAFAAEGDITISVVESASGASVAGHIYEVYQIFTGDVANDGKTMSNAAFGANYAPAGKTVDVAMAELSEMDPADAAAFLVANKTGTAIATLNDEAGFEITVPTGYYLVIDVTPDEDLPEHETKSAYILQALEDVDIQSKHDKAPITYKKIDDKNDSTGTENEIEWHDSADHDINDDIDFKLYAKIPSSFNLFKQNNVDYPFTFHDVEEAGLTFNNDAKVYVDGVEITEGFRVESPATGDCGCTFDVIFDDLTDIEAVKAGSEITVRYTSELNSNAVHGEEGNVNKMRGEFRNYYKPETPEYTPWDTVIAFTYKVIVNKYDDQEKLLAGAEFKLEKFIASDTGSVTYEGVKGDWAAKGEPVKTEAGKIFTFNGLDDGYYRLTETVTPNGYNTIEPIVFTVTANHDVIWETQEREDVLTSLSGNKATGDIRDIKFTATKSDGSVSTDVVNKAGVVLPETGGIGTTIFYVLGGIMVLAAVVLLVTKKRMASAE